MPNNVIPFPRKEESTPAPQQRIICQIGAERFAIDWTIVELPLEPLQFPTPTKRQRKPKLKRGEFSTPSLDHRAR